MQRSKAESGSAVALALTFPAAAPLGSAQVNPANADFFEAKVRPILATACYSCHTNSMLGGVRVDSRDGLLKGGKRGPSIMPGDPDKSLLI